jgi:hypothetical protein
LSSATTGDGSRRPGGGSGLPGCTGPGKGRIGQPE